MTRNQGHQTEIIVHECITRSPERMRAPKIMPPTPDQPAKPFQCTTRASASALLVAKTAKTNAHTDR